MSKLNQEELLEEVKIMKGVVILTLKNNRAHNFKKRIKTIEQACQQIKELIQKPGVTEELVKRWVKKIGCAPYHIEGMLAEAGVEVVGE